jgi:EmrB/QacA subfamily drug resistance transporter
VLLATILGSSMAFIDGTVVNIAVPVLQTELGATASQAQWVVQAYSLVLSALILVGGALGDRLGRRRLFVIGIVVFTLASIACGFSSGLAELVGARAVQGLGAALLTPESLAIISASFAGDERGRAIGTWSGFTSLTAAAGPLIGGLVIAAGSWRYAFFLNVPVALAALTCTLRVPESRASGELPRIDWGGAALATLGLGALVYAFTTASTAGFRGADVILSLAAGALLLGAFVRLEHGEKAPMVPLGLFQSRTFSGANLFTLLLYAPLGGALFFFPFDLIQVQRYSPQAAGAAFLPFVLLMFLLSRWSGRLVARHGARLPLAVGGLVAGVGFALFAMPGTSGSYWTTFFPAVVVLGFGMAITAAPLSTTAMSAVEPAHAGVASGINNAVSRTAGVLALAVLSVLAVARFGAALDGRLRQLDVPEEVKAAMLNQRIKLAAAEVPSNVDPGTTRQLQLAVDQSFVSSFRVVMLVGAAMAFSASACAFFAIDEVSPRASDRR